MNYDELRMTALGSMATFVGTMFLAKTGRDFVWGEHHRIICAALDDVVDGKCDRLMINIAPRYGKTELVSKMFISYGLAVNPASRFLHLSYSDDLVQDNSKDILEFVGSPAYRQMFPDVIPASNSAKKWYTTAGGGVYAVSTAGQVTGFGAGIVPEDTAEWLARPACKKFGGAVVIDDPLKPVDAFSDSEREKINARYTNTILSRLNSIDTPIIIVAQRLHEHDFCAHVQQCEPGRWRVISLPAIVYDPEPRALWPFKHSLADLEAMRTADAIMFETQYLQNPTPREGLMYGTFPTYETLPAGRPRIRNYTDTADKGADYLCSIDYAEFPDGIYVLDVLFTQKPMEYTEPETARMLTRDGVEQAVVESNNGGRGFRRNVEQSCRLMGNYTTQFRDLTQTQNKDARIYSHSAKATNIVHFPLDWERRWPEFAGAIKGYRKAGRNAHDDAPDCLTGCIEEFESGRGSIRLGFGRDYE